MNWKAADRVLLEEIDGRLKVACERAGARMACKPGCADCCIGLFTINELDARRLGAGVEGLRQTDPARAEAVVERARGVLDQIKGSFPGDSKTGRLDPDDPGTDAFVERFSQIACPALDPSTQLCDLYEHRPLSCRTFGLPVKINEESLPPCSLCFKGASAKEIDAHRIDPDPDGLEHAILCELTGTGAMSDETVVAYAVLTPHRRDDD